MTDEIPQAMQPAPDTIAEMAAKQSSETQYNEGDFPKWGNGEKFDIKGFDLSEVEGFDPSRFNNMGDVIKSNVSLRRKVRDQQDLVMKAPETYTIDPEQFNLEDPLLQGFLNISKENNISQEFIDKATTLFSSQIKEQAAAKEADVKKWTEEQMQLIGDNGAERMQKINMWAQKQGLNDDQVKHIGESIKSASDFKIWEAMASRGVQYSNPPGKNSPVVTSARTKETATADLLKAFKDNGMRQDQKYNEKLMDLARQVRDG